MAGPRPGSAELPRAATEEAQEPSWGPAVGGTLTMLLNGDGRGTLGLARIAGEVAPPGLLTVRVGVVGLG